MAAPSEQYSVAWSTPSSTVPSACMECTHRVAPSPFLHGAMRLRGDGRAVATRARRAHASSVLVCVRWGRGREPASGMCGVWHHPHIGVV